MVKTKAKKITKSSKVKNNELHKDIIVLEEKPYKQPRSTLFFIVIMCVLILFLILSKNIPFIVENFEFLTNGENLKFYFMLLIMPTILGIKIYFDYKKSKKMSLKL